jgi:nitroreductase
MVVERKETLKDLANSKDHGAGLIDGADKAIVVVADTMVADTWIEDSSIALTYMHLMAAELGLGSCWVQIHLRSKNGKDSEEIVRDILKIDDHYRVVGIMALGHSDDIPPAHELADVDKNKVHFMV